MTTCIFKSNKLLFIKLNQYWNKILHKISAYMYYILTQKLGLKSYISKLINPFEDRGVDAFCNFVCFICTCKYPCPVMSAS